MKATALLFLVLLPGQTRADQPLIHSTVGVQPSRAPEPTKVLPRVSVGATSQQAGQEARLAADGDDSTFWSSETYPEAVHTERVFCDLGTYYRVHKLNVLPRPGERGFPVDFRVVYAEGQATPFGASLTWKTAPEQGYTHFPPPGSAEQQFRFTEPITAQYIGIEASRLGPTDEGRFACQVAELTAIGFTLPCDVQACSTPSRSRTSQNCSTGSASTWTACNSLATGGTRSSLIASCGRRGRMGCG